MSHPKVSIRPSFMALGLAALAVSVMFFSGPELGEKEKSCPLKEVELLARDDFSISINLQSCSMIVENKYSEIHNCRREILISKYRLVVNLDDISQIYQSKEYDGSALLHFVFSDDLNIFYEQNLYVDGLAREKILQESRSFTPLEEFRSKLNRMGYNTHSSVERCDGLLFQESLSTSERSIKIERKLGRSELRLLNSFLRRH